MDYKNSNHNSLSVSADFKLVLIGKSDHVEYRRSNGIQKLKGTNAYVNWTTPCIYTFNVQNENTSWFYTYDIEGTLKDQKRFKGAIASLVTSADGQEVFIILNTKERDDNKGNVIRYRLSDGSATNIFQTSIYKFTSAACVSSKSFVLAGPREIHFISTNGDKIRVAEAPDWSFVKTNYLYDKALVLQEYSDGSYIEVYSADGTLLRKIEYMHEENSIVGTRRCGECKDKQASFTDFDVSPDNKYFVGLDQFGKVIVLDEGNQLLRKYEDSSDWCFISFISNNEFVYFDKKSESVKKEIINK